MTQFDYIFISFALMLGVCILNARMARAGFQEGDRRSGWISLVLSALGGAAALFNLTQLARM